jgi:phytoene synthase
MTNILRDVAEDAGRGRVYLPAEDLNGLAARRTGLAATAVTPSDPDKFEAEHAPATTRADRWRPAAAAGARGVSDDERDYRGFTDAIVRRDYDVFSGRVRLSKDTNSGWPQRRQCAGLVLAVVSDPRRPSPSRRADRS